MAGFESAEKQFSIAYEGLSAQVDALDSLDQDELKDALPDVQKGLAKAEELIRNMDLEARTGDPALRPSLLSRLREHKIRVLSLKKSLRHKGGGTGGTSASGAGGQGHPLSSVLDGGNAAADDVESASNSSTTGAQRDRLLSSTGRLGATSTRIGDTRRMALQAEQLGVTILSDLHDQRQSLLHAHDMLDDVDGEISKARHILRTMVAKMNRNKWAIGGIILLLFLAIAAVIYLKLHLQSF